MRWPRSFAGPVTTARCGSQRMMRAPIETSLSVKNSRFSNIFSKRSTVPRAWVATVSAIEVQSDGNAGQGPSSIFGMCPPMSSSTWSFCPGGTRTLLSPSSTWTPSLANVGRIETRSSGLDPVDREVATSDRGEADEARDLDVIRANRPLAAERGGRCPRP